MPSDSCPEDGAPTGLPGPSEGAGRAFAPRSAGWWLSCRLRPRPTCASCAASRHPPPNPGKGNVEILESRTRGAGKQHEVNQEAQDALNAHQAELEERMRLEALERLQTDGSKGKEERSKATPVAYRDPNQYPTASSSGGPLKTHQTFVDGKQEAVLIPIHGRLVPFHISTVKNDQPVQNGLPPVSGRRPLGLPGLSRGSGRTFAPRSAA